MRGPDAGAGRGGYDWTATVVTAASTLLAVGLLVVVVRGVLRLDFEALTLSPLAWRTPEDPRYTGFLGSLAVFGWAVASGITALAASLTRLAEASRYREVLTWSAGMSVLLLVDEGFAVHHAMAPLWLGVPKDAVLVGIALVAAGWLLACGRQLLSDPDLPILAWALLWLGTALAVDGVADGGGRAGAVEESAKLVGMGAWVTFHWRLARRAVVSAYRPAARRT